MRNYISNFENNRIILKESRKFEKLLIFTRFLGTNIIQGKLKYALSPIFLVNLIQLRKLTFVSELKKYISRKKN
jgi:hypothetical protein